MNAKKRGWQYKETATLARSLEQYNNELSYI